MSDENLVHHCAPTLAGIKAGNLFSNVYPDHDSMVRDVRHFNGILVPHGIVLLPLKYENGWTLFYLYRPEELESELSQKEADEILNELGYREAGVNRKIGHLIRRLNGNCGFPHEIGLFLSYPPEDVRGFMENKARGFKHAGFWKVYGDEKSARETFFRYRRCEDSYIRHLKKGATLEQLIIGGGKRMAEERRTS